MDLGARIAASSITFRDEPLEGALDRLREIGFTSLDLVGIRHYCDHFDPLLVDVGEKECARIRDVVAARDMLTISLTTYPANPLAKDLNADDWTEGVDAYVRLGLYLQAKQMILPPGRPAPPADRWRGTAERAKPWLREGARRAQNAHMQPVLALQSGSLLRTSQQGIDLLNLLSMRGMGLAVDPAHLAAVGEDPAAAIRNMGAAVAFVVLRDTDGADYELPPGSGTLDYPGILAALDEIRYAGPLVLAIDNTSLTPDQRVALLRRGWDYLQGLTSQRKAA